MSKRLLHQSFLPKTPRRSVHAFVWKYSHEYGGLRPRHFHIEPELNLVVRGWAEFGIGEAVVRVSEGELVGFPAGQDHALLATSEDVYLYAIGMDPKLASEALNGRSGEACVPLHLRLDGANLASVMRQAASIVDQPGVEQACAELWQQTYWLGQHDRRGLNGPLSVLTTRALEVVSEAPELALEQVARYCRGNPSEVSRHFHHNLGMTFVRYRTRLRLLRFIELVEERRGDWASAAIAAGFGSYSQCHRSFKSELGCSPRSFCQAGLREQMQEAYEDGSKPELL